MDNISYSLNIDVTSQLLSYDVYVASKNDTNIRNINIALFENGNTVQLSKNASATASFVTDNVLIDDGVVCTINGNVITVPLTDLQKHGNLEIQVTVTDGDKTLVTPYPIQVKVTPNIAENAQIDENSKGSYAEVVQEIFDARGGFDNLSERLNSITGGNIPSVLNYGAVGDGVADDSEAVINAIKNSNILIFPPGTYKIAGAEFESLSDRALIFNEAELIYEGENNGSVLKFSGCDNIGILGGTFDGSNTAKFGLNFVNSKNVKLDSVSVKNIGNESTAGTSGINFTGDCSYSKLNDVYIDGVTSGQSDGNYIFAHGIGFIRSSDGDYSKHVEINHPVIKNIGYVDGKNYVNATDVEKDGAGKIISGKVNGKTCKADIIEEVDVDEFHTEFHARIDGDGIFLVQPEKEKERENEENELEAEKENELEAIESYFKINNVDISNCSKRALKIVTRCVDVDGGEINVATWSAAVEVQRVRNSSLRNLKITDKTYTPVTINGGDGLMVIDNCRITGGGMNSKGSGGIVLGAKSTGVVEGSETVHIENCVFDNVKYPVYAAINSKTAGKTDSEELVIKDCFIKHFYGDAAIKLEDGRYQRLGKLIIENVSFAYGTSTATVFFNNNNFYKSLTPIPSDFTPIPLNSRLFDFFSPEKTVKVICDSMSDDFPGIFESYNLTTPNQIFEMPLQPDVFFTNPDEQVELKSGDYDSDGENKFKASVAGNTVILSETTNKTYKQGDKVIVELESPLTVSKDEKLFLTIYNSHPRVNSVNDLTFNFYEDKAATQGALSVHDKNYSGGYYTAYVKEKTYELSLDKSLTLETMVIRVNALTDATITEGIEIAVSLKTEKKLKDIYTKAEVDGLDEAKADKADTNAQFERLIAVLQNKAGKAETLAGYGINDAYTKAEVNALIGTSKIDIGEAQITIDDSTFVYDGNSHVPNVTSVVLNGVQLTYGVDYAVIATPATNAGDYVITVNGIGDYDGTATVNWHINKAQAIINGDESITIRGIGESVTKTYTTNGDGALSFTASGGVATVTNVGGAVTVTSTEIGSGILTVTVAESQNYLSAEKTVNITVQEAVTSTVFGVMWDYSLSSPELTRLTPQTDPLGEVTNVPTQEPTACIGTEGGQSDFDNYMPWAGIQRFNYVDGQIVDFVDYTNGETYVWIPEFWSKIVDDSENSKMYFYISSAEINGFTKHLGSGRYVARYPCGTDYKSIPNSAPIVDKTIDEFRTALRAKDIRLYVSDIHTYEARQLLTIVEWANFNSQDCIGMGVVAGSVKNSGATDLLTYHTGRADGTNNQSAIQYRWMENPWGNVWQFVDGVLVNDYTVYICNNVDLYGDSLSENYINTGAILPYTFGYVKTLTGYNNGYIFPHYVGGSDSTYICDYNYGNTGLRSVLIGGTTNNGTGAGLFFWSSYDDSSVRNKTTTARPMLILNNGGNN